MTIFEKEYLQLLDSISKFTDLDSELILRATDEESVNARSVLIFVLSHVGLNDTIISKLTNITRQSVNQLRNGYTLRKRNRKLIPIIEKEALKELERIGY